MPDTLYAQSFEILSLTIFVKHDFLPCLGSYFGPVCGRKPLDNWAVFPSLIWNVYFNILLVAVQVLIIWTAQSLK